MSYSLVNMPVVGFDLCRLAGGTELAEILLHTLELDEPALRTLAGTPRPPRRRLTPAPELADTLREMRDRINEPDSPIASAVHALERSMIGDFDALIRLVRDDILEWTWHETGSVRWQLPEAVAALDVLADEMAGVYGHPRGDWARHASCGAHADIDLGPCGPRVYFLLERVSAMTPAQTRQLRAAAVGRSPRTQWASAVHDASWAVYLTGRLRPAAAAQLLAVQVFAEVGLTAHDAAYGVWNAISGAVQATVVEDLLPGPTLDQLTRACDEALRRG